MSLTAEEGPTPLGCRTFTFESPGQLIWGL